MSQKKSILDKYNPFPIFAWRHGIIRDTIESSQAGAGTKVAVPRCDHYSDYMTYEEAVWLADVQEILKEHIDNFPKSESMTMGNSSTALNTTYPHEEVQKWLDELRILVGLKEKP